MAEPSAPIASKAESGKETEERRRNYNRLVRLAKLKTILLEKLDFKVAADIYCADKSLLRRELSVETDLLSYEGSDGQIVANIKWSIVIKLKKKNIAKSAVSYIIMYDGAVECQEEIVKLFIDHVGKTATYAYFRALYAHLDWSANIGSPPLPVLQFQPRI